MLDDEAIAEELSNLRVGDRERRAIHLRLVVVECDEHRPGSGPLKTCDVVGVPNACTRVERHQRSPVEDCIDHANMLG